MKLLYFLFLLVAWTTAQNADPGVETCVVAYNNCKQSWFDATKSLTTSQQKCESAREWSECIEAAVRNDICSGEQGAPPALEQELDVHCGESQDCEDARNECREKYESSKGSDACAAVREWLLCNEEAQTTGICTDIPEEVYEEQKKSCQSAEKDGECTAAVQACRSTWEIDFDANQPNVLKCKLAEVWDRCLKSARESSSCRAASVEIPEEVGQQLSFCNIPDVTVDMCEEGVKLCRDTWSSGVRAARTSDERCNAATSWRDCLESESFLEDCPTGVDVPVEVQETMLYHCTPAEEDANSCSGMEDECARRFLVARDSNKEKCESFKEWENCLQEAKAQGCGIAFPTDLEQNLELCQNEDGCAARVRNCKVEQFDNQDENGDSCQQAKNWRSCLEDLLSVCQDFVSYPVELETLEATTCYVRDSSRCLIEQSKCRKDWQDSVEVTGESCVYAKKWRSCLEELFLTCNDILMPGDLDMAEATNCYARPYSCSNRKANCKNEYEDGLAEASDKCAHVRSWRSCLVGLVQDCSVEFPMALNTAEATTCYGFGRASDSRPSPKQRDAGGADLSCKERARRCKHSAVIYNRRTSNRCDQAKEWRSCLEDLQTNDCRDVKFPFQLNQLQATSCYGGTSAPVAAPAAVDDGKKKGVKDDKDRKKKKDEPKASKDSKDSKDSCKKKTKKCEPARANTCNDALRWRKCLEDLRTECGQDIFPQDLDILQATSC